MHQANRDAPPKKPATEGSNSAGKRNKTRSVTKVWVYDLESGKKSFIAF